MPSQDLLELPLIIRPPKGEAKLMGELVLNAGHYIDNKDAEDEAMRRTARIALANVDLLLDYFPAGIKR